MNVRVLVKAAMAVILALPLSACGYYNPYVAGKCGKPIMVYRTMWANRTNEMGLENIFYQAQSDWLRKSRLITLGDSPEGADYRLNGTIERVDYPEISFGKYQIASQGRVELTVNFTLTEMKSGKAIWKRNATRTQTFAMGQDPMKLQTSRRAAFEKIADLFGEEIYLYMINTIIRPGAQPPAEEVDEKVIQD